MSAYITDRRQYLWQWDSGRSLTVDSPAGEIVERVDFATVGYPYTLSMIPDEEGVVQIPNILLQEAGFLTAWVVSVDENGDKTEASYVFQIRAKQKPDAYVYTETQAITWNKLIRDAWAAIQEKVDSMVVHFDFNTLTPEQREQLRGEPGPAGSDATVTLAKIIEVLGYMPGNKEDVAWNTAICKVSILCNTAEGEVLSLRDSAAYPIDFLTSTIRQGRIDVYGKNMLNVDYGEGTQGFTNIYVGVGTQLTLSTNAPLGSDGSANIFIMGSKDASGGPTGTNGAWIDQPRTVTSTDGWVCIRWFRRYGVDIAAYKNQVELGAEATAYVTPEALQTGSFADINAGSAIINGHAGGTSIIAYGGAKVKVSYAADEKTYVDAGLKQTDLQAKEYAAAAERSAKSYADALRLIFKNIAVAATAFKADTTYKDYGFKANIPLTGVTASMIPDVVFPVVDYGLCPVASSYAGGVSVWAEEAKAMTIPVIIMWRGD